MSKCDKTPLEERFRENLLIFISNIRSYIIEAKQHKITDINPTVCDLVKLYINNKNPRDLITNFLYRSYAHWDLIAKKDKSYFVNHAMDVFSSFKEDYSEYFESLTKIIKNKKIFKEEDEELFWIYIFTFVKQTILFVKDLGLENFKYCSCGKEEKIGSIEEIVKWQKLFMKHT